MCGITGFTGEKNTALLHKMADLISHRGPDDDGFLEKDGISFGHRRLSIIGIETGKQPIFNEDRSVAVIYNGEIYNYLELRDDLIKKGHTFTTNTDTEILVHLYEEEGIDFLKKLNGMFAFALWDDNNKKLFLVRDQIGIKPLYYTISNNQVYFSSEIKSLVQSEILVPEVDEQALREFLFFRYVPNKKTLFKNVNKLMQGDILEFCQGDIKISNYKNFKTKIDDKKTEPYQSHNFKNLIEGSVEKRLMSEVPLGVFLSGGLDSSTITAFTCLKSLGKIKTFSVSFDCHGENSELPFARMVSNYYNTEHHELIVKNNDVIDNLPLIAWHYDEPMGDAAVVPTFLISRYAKDKIKVVLAGEGSDEQLAGYTKYEKMKEKYLSTINSPKQLAKEYFKEISVFMPEDLNKLLKNFNQEEFIQDTTNFVTKSFQDLVSNNLINNMLYFDQNTMLSENYLMKADKMSMSQGIEERVPFLDKNILKFTHSLPENLKLQEAFGSNKEKFLLKKTMSSLLPLEIINRKKKGYGTPTKEWFRGKIGEVFEKRILNSKAFSKFFDANYILKLLQEHRSGKKKNNTKLWSLLAFDLWYEIYIERKVVRPNESFTEFFNINNKLKVNSFEQ